MGRRSFIILISVAAILVIAAVVYFSGSHAVKNPGTFRTAQGTTVVDDIQGTAAGQEVTEEASTGQAISKEASAGTSTQTGNTEQAVSILQDESIEVRYNTPEYDLKVSVYENSSKQTFIKLEYYKEGVSTITELDSTSIPEIRDIFEKRSSKNLNSDAYKVKYAYLNSKFTKLYLFINSDVTEDIAQISVYVVNLLDQSVKRLAATEGKFAIPAFNKDFSLLGYSWFDSPLSSVFQEKVLFDVIDCKSDDFIVKGSRDKAGNRIGTDRDAKTVYDYIFVSWKSNTAAILNQGTWPQNDAAAITAKQVEVLYDINKNRFFNTDGSEIKPPENNPEKPGDKKVPVESEALKTLKSFYNYLASEKDYGKAMELLDPDFRLQFVLLQQFGVDYIVKSDIDVKEASIYGEILKAAKLDGIIKEEQKDGILTVYYYQSLALNADSQVRNPLSAQVKKSGGTWKITLIKDEDETKPPFKQ